MQVLFVQEVRDVWRRGGEFEKIMSTEQLGPRYEGVAGLKETGHGYVTLDEDQESFCTDGESWCLKVWLALFQCHTLALMSSLSEHTLDNDWLKGT